MSPKFPERHTPPKYFLNRDEKAQRSKFPLIPKTQIKREDYHQYEMNPEEYDRWFSEATNDYQSGPILLFFRRYNNAVFYFVQTAEKALKALLYLRELKPWGHSLSALITLVQKAGFPIDPELERYAGELDRHYMPSRYPDAVPYRTPHETYTRALAKDVRKKVKYILNYVKHLRP